MGLKRDCDCFNFQMNSIKMERERSRFPLNEMEIYSFYATVNIRMYENFEKMLHYLHGMEACEWQIRWGRKFSSKCYCRRMSHLKKMLEQIL